MLEERSAFSKLLPQSWKGIIVLEHLISIIYMTNMEAAIANLVFIPFPATICIWTLFHAGGK